MNFYRALLYLYPKSFRQEYGDSMREIFAHRVAASDGAFAFVALWLSTLFDVTRNAALTHLDILSQDLKFTLRTLARTPGFTLTAILVAALGIGATTAAFSVTDRVLIRELPFRDADRLVKVWQTETGYSRYEPSPGLYRDWRKMATSFEDMGAYSQVSMNLINDGTPARVQGASVSANLFPILGAAPQVGRLFTAEEDADHAAGTIILSFGLWMDVFGGKASAIGATVRLDEEPYTVVGVMPRTFTFPDRDTRFWSTLRIPAVNYEDRTNTYLRLVAKLKTGVSLDAARADMAIVTTQLKKIHPKDNSATVVMLSDEVPSQARLLLVALFGAALCVLLIACTNLASLLIARSLQRRKELAVRTAIGAGRERLIRQLVTESVLLALCGGALGIALAASVTPLLAQLAPTNLPITETAAIDLRVLGFAALMTILTGIGFGVMPAVSLNQDASLDGLRDGARGGTAGRNRVRSALVFTEVAISVVLLVSCGLLVRALWRVQQVDPGFQADGVLTARTSLPMTRYAPTLLRAQFYQAVLEDVRALPGVKSAAYASFLPMVMRGGIWPVTLPGREEKPSDDKVSMRFATPDYFKTMGIALIKGRDFSAFDTKDAPAVVLVSDSFARKYWPNEEALGRVVNITFQDRIIVGVVADVRVRGLERVSEPQVYLGHLQIADGATPFYAPKDLVIRVAGDPARLASSVREIVGRVDPQVPISDVRTMSAIVESETSSRSAQLSVLQAFALIATLLAGVGLHGLLAFTVSNRLQEIGVRIALGASNSHILRLIMKDGLRLAVGGVFVGLGLAYGAAVSMQALLAGLDPADPKTFAAAGLVVVLMTLVGTALPAFRAIRVNPTSVMRTE